VALQVRLLCSAACRQIFRWVRCAVMLVLWLFQHACLYLVMRCGCQLFLNAAAADNMTLVLGCCVVAVSKCLLVPNYVLLLQVSVSNGHCCCRFCCKRVL
jgi:hypothetical protein